MQARNVLASNLHFLMERFPDVGSQKLLFKTTGVTTSTVGRIRRAEVSATIDNIEALAKAFKVPVFQMLDPRLPEIIGATKSSSSLEKSAQLAAQIQELNLSDAQLAILSNTLAAMRSQ